MSNKTRWLAFAGAAVAGIALISAQQTGALWSQTVPVGDGATIHSGILDLSVGQGGTADYPFSALAGANLFPGGYAQAPVTIYNSGNVLMKYRLQSASQSNTAVPLDLTVSTVAAESACPAQGAPTGATQIYQGPMVGAQAPSAPQWRTVQPGASEVLCLRGTVGAAAAANASTTAAFSFVAESR